VAQAAPEGEQVVHGEASFERDGANTLITTTTHETIIDYDSFDIQIHESVRIDQPDAASRVLNRVHPGDPTHIDGALSSNGIVYILNASGVFFGGEAIIDVARLVAGAGQISNEDFLNRIDHLTDVGGAVEVASGTGGRIEAASVLLIGQTVANHGTIIAPDGMIALVAGGDVLLTEIDGRMRVRVEAVPADPGNWAVQQTGTVDAGRGSVTLTAGDAYSLAMNHSGITRGREVLVEGGEGGLVVVAGEIDAANRAPEGRGGSIRVLGEKVAVLDAELDASGDAGGGEILVGGDYQGAGDTRTALRTYVDAAAQLRADALAHGDGGRVIVWSEEKTGFFGDLSARGGVAGGDGGFAEISSKRILESRGAIDLSAPEGNAGTLLYDPEKIEIVGGTPEGMDGTDNDNGNNPLLLWSDDGITGEILFGDTGDPAAEPFIIYESEIEKTDANIRLEANHSITATGTFNHQTEENPEGENVVVLAKDRWLILQTRTPTTTDLEAGIDLISQVDLDPGETLTWRVSGAGQFFADTGQFAPVEGGAQSAPIQIGAIEADGVDTFTDSLTAPAVQITTNTGAIEVAAIQANGIDAEPPAPDAPEGTDPLAATAGGRILIVANSGDISIGDVEAVGGSAIDVAEDGAGGGFLEVRAYDGDLSVTGDVDVSGGDGLAGADVGAAQREVGLGGSGGTIDLCAGSACPDSTAGENTTPRNVFVRGDLFAHGGEGVANPAEPDAATAFGGGAGTIRVVSTTGRVEAGFDASGDPLAAPVEIEVTAGQGQDGGGSGGNPAVGFGFVAIQASDGVALNANIDASGGDAVAGPGGAGGAISITSTEAGIRAGTSELRSDGGAGTTSAGAAGSASLNTANEAELEPGSDALDIELGSVLLRGGAGEDAADGGAGGQLGIVSAGAIAKGAGQTMTVDVSGGGATGTGSDGSGGSIALDAHDGIALSVAGSGDPTQVDLTLRSAKGSVDVDRIGGSSGVWDVEIVGAANEAGPQTISRFDTGSAEASVDYRLDVETGTPALLIERGAVDVGPGGGSLANSDGAILGAAGSGAHIVAAGDFALEGTELGPIAAIGAPGATLELVAAGDVRVDLSSESGERFDVVDLTQRDVTANSLVDSRDAIGNPTGSITIVGDPVDAQKNTIAAIRTVGSGQAFAYRLDTAEVADFVVGAGAVDLGGDLLLEASGDVRLEDGATNITANGSGVTLVAGGAIADERSGDPTDAANGFAIDEPGVLRLDGGSVGAPDAPIRVSQIGLLAGAATQGGFYLSNLVGGDLRISQLTGLEDDERIGISADTDVDLWNAAAGGRIVLDQLAAGATHVSSGGDQTYHAPVELENARVDDIDGVLTPSNTARLAAGGDVVFDDRLDTSPDATVSIELTAGGSADVVVPGTLVVSSGGMTRLGGDVGAEGPLGALETGAVGLTRDTSFELGAPAGVVEDPLEPVDWSAFVGRAHFGGPIDGAHAMNVAAVGADEMLSSITFAGDVGADTALSGLDAGADAIYFSGAARSVRVDGDVRLGAVDARDEIPDVATIAAPDGSLEMTVGGKFTAGTITPNGGGDPDVASLEKISVAGAFDLRAGEEATVGDVAAVELSIDAPRIVWKGRAEGPVLLADGSTITDTGVDMVANDIVLAAVPEWDGAGATPTLVVGSGGVSAPGSLGDFEVIRLNDDLDAVTTASFAGPDGVVLDLTGNGPPVVGDPTSDLPRPEPSVMPAMGPRLDDADIAGAPAGVCPDDLASQQRGLDDSALATPRASDIAARYRDLIASPDAHARLRASFGLALRAYRASEGRAGPVDGARLYTFLQASPPYRETVEQVDELARLLTEIEMLGLGADDSQAVRRAVAAAFAESVADPEFGTDAVLAAVGASGIGLPVPL
jgi:filamentous hemagglutinin family protein